LSGQDQRHRLGRLCFRWNATGDELLPPHGVRIQDHSTLQVQGLHLGYVESLSALHNESQFGMHYRYADGLPASAASSSLDADIFKRLSRALTLYRRDLVPEHARDLDWNYAILFHTFYTDEGMETGPAYQRRSQRDRSILRNWRRLNQDFVIQGKSLRRRALSVRQSFKANAFGPAASRLFIDGLSGVGRFQGASYRKPLATDIGDALDDLQDLIEEGMRLMCLSGDQFGWAHPEARPGDRVFLIAGCSMPVVVRRAETSHCSRQCFTVVGHAYVEGVMDGVKWSGTEREALTDVFLV
jgi:hypothetical protein